MHNIDTVSEDIIDNVHEWEDVIDNVHEWEDIKNQGKITLYTSSDAYDIEWWHAKNIIIRGWAAYVTKIWNNLQNYIRK